MQRIGLGAAAAAMWLLALAPAGAAEEQKPAEQKAAEQKPAEHKPTLKEMIATHAKSNGVPESLVHRVILRESRYNARAVGAGGAMGLMQIKHGTARALGYKGPASGLLDADTNLTYAVRYLAGAYRAANGNADRAASFYRTGYYRSKRASAPVLASAKSVPVKLTPAKPARLDADATSTRTDGRSPPQD